MSADGVAELEPVELLRGTLSARLGDYMLHGRLAWATTARAAPAPRGRIVGPSVR